MFGLPRWVSEFFMLSLFPQSACGATMSSAGVGGLSPPPDGFLTCYVVPHMLTQCV